MNAADVTLASTVWLQSPDIVVVTPMGRTEGWDSVQRDVYVNFLQKAFLERDLSSEQCPIHVDGNSATSTKRPIAAGASRTCIIQDCRRRHELSRLVSSDIRFTCSKA